MAQWKTALRSLFRRPAFALTTILVLAFGIGANSALFSVLDTVLLKPLPFSDPGRIVHVMEANPAKRESTSLIAPVRVEDWNRLNETFQAIAGIYTENVTDTSHAEPERLAGRRVSPRYFQVLDMRPLLGRTFRAEEEQFGGPGAAVISEGLWTRRYRRDPAALGQRLTLSGKGYTIVGVMPREFAPASIEVWLPAQINQWLMKIREARFYTGIGRLKPGVTIQQARADLNRVQQRLGEQFPKTDQGWAASVGDYKQWVVGSTGRELYLMFGAAGLLLLILCANVAGLMLGQLQRREREFAIRSSLGAGRVRLLGLIMRETSWIALLSGACGLVLAAWGSQFLTKVFAALPRMQELHFDWRVILFTIAATALAALLFGLTPALRIARSELNTILAQSSRSQAGSRRWFQQTLVASQFTITLVLLAGAGLLLRSYYNLTRVNPGFSTAGVITFHMGAEWSEDRNKLGVLQQQFLRELGQLPGVQAAGMANFLPASGATLRYQVAVEGSGELGDNGKLTVGERSISPGYFETLRVPVLQGASCPELKPGKALVNRRFAELAGNVNLIGRQLQFDGAGMQPDQIVGVVENVKEDALNTVVPPYVYACLAAGGWPDPEYVAAVTGDPRSAIRGIRDLVHKIAPQRALFGVTTLAAELDKSLDQPRLNAGLLSVFAASALISAALGLYGLVMLTVTGRTKEIGVRVALGARTAQIVATVVAEAARSLAMALIFGIAIALIALRQFRTVLFEVTPADALTFTAVCGALVLVAVIAAAIPSRRAARIDPLEALRTE